MTPTVTAIRALLAWARAHTPAREPDRGSITLEMVIIAAVLSAAAIAAVAYIVTKITSHTSAIQ